jgi:hypothetical protein
MSTWTSGELDVLAAATELRIGTRRPDGTFRPAVPIWVVRVGDGIYIRSYRGPAGAWFRHATTRGTAHIQTGTVTSDVSFGRAYIDPMTSGSAAATTLQLTPQH